jgi:5-hydroxyisourate hydrolase-like protein (transthyretin family)
MHRARSLLRRPVALLLALAMVLAGLGVTSAAALGSPSDGHITGVVTGPSGTPITNVWVQVAYLNDGNWALAASTITHFDGRYEVDVPEGGPHILVFSHPGYATEYYDDATTEATATNLPVTAGVTTVADAELAVAGHVTGTITGTGGIGVPDVAISAWQRVGTDWQRTAATTYTDAEGDYDLDELATGDFRLKFERPYGSEYLSEWWDDTWTLETATTVSVTGGATTSGKDAELSADGPKPSPVGNTMAPTIIGQPRVGTTVTAAPGTWNPAGTTLFYQWLVAGTPVAYATTSSYQPTPTDVGKPLQVRVTATAAGHTTGTATSAAVTIGKGALEATKKPKVTGKARKGATLKVSPGTWSTNATVTYRWYAGAKAIPKATAAKLKLAGKTLKKAKGKAISVLVTVAAPGDSVVTTRLNVPGKAR